MIFHDFPIKTSIYSGSSMKSPEGPKGPGEPVGPGRGDGPMRAASDGNVADHRGGQGGGGGTGGCRRGNGKLLGGFPGTWLAYFPIYWE